MKLSSSSKARVELRVRPIDPLHDSFADFLLKASCEMSLRVSPKQMFQCFLSIDEGQPQYPSMQRKPSAAIRTLWCSGQSHLKRSLPFFGLLDATVSERERGLVHSNVARFTLCTIGALRNSRNSRKSFVFEFHPRCPLRPMI